MLSSTGYYRQLKVLELESAEDWQTIRAQYRRLVQKWHPDRYSGAAQLKAEARLKEINGAFALLEEYYRNAVRQGDETDPDTGKAKNTPPTETVVPRSRYEHRPPDTLRVKSWGIPGFVGLLVIGGLIYLLVDLSSPPDSGQQPVTSVPPTGNPARENPNPETDRDFSRLVAELTYIRVGSTEEEVYGIQGAPKKIHGDMWYYGESIIFFENGRVAAWQEAPNHPLRTGPVQQNVPSDATLSPGMKQEQVRRIQGEPDRVTNTRWPIEQEIWEYGDSRVFFRDGRVVGWDNTPEYPLRVLE